MTSCALTRRDLLRSIHRRSQSIVGSGEIIISSSQIIGWRTNTVQKERLIGAASMLRRTFKFGDFSSTSFVNISHVVRKL